MNKKIIIGSRSSKLALIYAQNAKNKIIQNTNLNEGDLAIKEITTKGDQVQDIRLSEVGGKGLFSKNIEKLINMDQESLARPTILNLYLLIQRVQCMWDTVEELFMEMF